MLCHTLVHIKKTNKRQFKILEKGKYGMPDQIFEGFVGIVNDLTNEWWWIPQTCWTFKDVDIQMLHHNTCTLLFVTILLNHSVQCCYDVENSPLIYRVSYYSGCYKATLG